MKYLIAILVAIALTACDTGGGSSNQPSPAGVVSIKCADMGNETDTACAAQPVATGLVTVIDAGVIRRDEMIYATLVVANNTDTPWQGYWGMVIDAGCNGAETWEIATVQSTALIEPGGEWSTTVGGSCSDMPLGAHASIATIYDTDPATTLDVTQVQFELVE